jgi:hypothetical protein
MELGLFLVHGHFTDWVFFQLITSLDLRVESSEQEGVRNYCD